MSDRNGIRLLFIAAFFGFFAFILWIIVQADSGADNYFLRTVKLIPMGDKLGHIGLYGGLAYLLNLALERKHIVFGSFKMQWGSLLVLIFALVEELSQGFFATRSLDILDVTADFVAVIVANVLVRKRAESEQL